MKYILLITFIFLSLSVNAQKEDSVLSMDKATKRIYNVTKIDGDRPVIDGRLDDRVWGEKGSWSEKFVQVMPFERAPTDLETRVKIFYDDKNIYVGVWCYDNEPDKINKFIGNRDDNSLGDLISVAFDTYHDYRAAPEFNINAGGNKTDLVVTDKLSVNLSWNTVWEGRTHINLKDSCWTAELRIPFSQLRYNANSDTGIWGLHVRRIIRRRNEVQNWSMIPLKNNGHVFSFGEMHGMADPPKPRDIEFMPYVMGKLRKEPKIDGSPYQTGTYATGNVGFDAKFGVKDYTLDLTVNPDYGQVELDPSVMNLTAYETFYEEKRPFFLEGRHILEFANGGDMMFYTRRIGASPSYKPHDIDNTTSFYRPKESVPIIGALKFTGTSPGGVTIGVLQSVTALTSVKVTRDGHERHEVVEPLTNYTIARLQKNWKGNTLLGGMITSTNRVLKEQYLIQDMVANGFTGGIDFTQYFKNRLYYIDFKGMFSALDGSRSAITELQKSPVHYFQRESALGYLGIDTTRRSLSGSGGYLKIGRKGNEKWNFSENFGWSSPGFDLNDVGYLRETDQINNETEVVFRYTDIWKIFRYNAFFLTQTNRWSFNGTPLENNVALNLKSMTMSRLELDATGRYVLNKLDTRMLRGGPDMRFDPFFVSSIKFNTDKSKRVMFSLQYMGEKGNSGASAYNSIIPGVNFRLWNCIFLSGNFNYQWNRNDIQYVGQSVSTAGKTKYIMGEMNQKTYGLTIRLQANITPDISLQYYGSPFTSVASYDNYKVATSTTSHKYNERTHIFTKDEISLNGNKYEVNVGKDKYSFSQPNFSFNEFRSNLVARWEYRPGSTLYFVWEYSSSGNDNYYVSGWGDNLDKMFGLPATNTFMIKLNYWFGL